MQWNALPDNVAIALSVEFFVIVSILALIKTNQHQNNWKWKLSDIFAVSGAI